MRLIFPKFLLAFFLGLALHQLVFAADIFFGAETNEVWIGEQFEVKLFVNTPEESVNAFEGKITFPSNLVKVKEIRDGNSIVIFWIDKPKAHNNAITFSGITPGGFQGNNGLLFSAVFETESEGVANFEIDDAKILQNDGTGSSAILAMAPLEIKISKEVSPATSRVTKIKDIEPPETFMPEIAADPEIFGGKWFLVFATQDKGSGIDHYEVCEGKRKCVIAESPYFLQNQNLDVEIVVKAIDKSGNERIVTIPAQKPRAWYKNYAILAILIIMVVAYLIWKTLWKERRK